MSVVIGQADAVVTPSPAPRIHLRASKTQIPSKTEIPLTELVLQQLCLGISRHRAEQYRRQCANPALMTKLTYRALCSLEQRLIKEGENYNRYRLNIVRDWLSRAESQSRADLAVHAPAI